MRRIANSPRIPPMISVRQVCGLFMVLGLVFAVVWLMEPERAEAIPVFSRKYGTSCQTCHIAFPKLNAFGEAFRLNGYQFPAGDEEFRVIEPIELGAERWKMVWPETIWPGMLPGQLPLSMRVSGTFDFDLDPVAGQPQSVASYPKAVNLLGAGAFHDDISFWMGAHLFQNGQAGSVERALLQFNDVLGDLQHAKNVSIRLGKFEPDVAPFSSHRRMVLTDYLLNTYNIEQGGIISGGGHQHEGGFSFSNSVTGVELVGLTGSRTAYVIGLGSSAPQGTEHDSLLEDYYARVMWKWGGLGFNGAPIGESYIITEEEEEEDNDEVDLVPAAAEEAEDSPGIVYEGLDVLRYGKDGQTPLAGQTTQTMAQEAVQVERAPMPWEDDSFRLGLFGYMGNNSTPGSTIGDFYRVGIDARWMERDLDLFGAYMHAADSPRDGAPDLEFDAWFTQGDYVIYPWLIGSMRYEEVQPDGFGTISRWVPSVTIMQRANIKWTIEAQLYPNNNGNGLLQVGVDFAF